MARSNRNDPAPIGADRNLELEHTRGGATTRDLMDAGVPMVPGDPREPIGPEDALGAGATRGDYRDRLVAGPALRTVRIPDEEREVLSRADDGTPLELGPAFRLVPAGEDVAVIGDEPGKGGVTTEAARAEVDAVAGGGVIQPAPTRTAPADGDDA